jgi:hypothetical protein
MTPERFIVDSPLFVKAPLENFNPPEKISLPCKTLITCEKELTTTWERDYVQVTLKPSLADPSIYSIQYRCYRCNKQRFTVIYRLMDYEERLDQSSPPEGLPGAPSSLIKERVPVGVMKVGQYSQPSVRIPKELEKNLGKDDASLYVKALMSRNNGFGLAAAMYMRRVVENKTNELIDVAAQLAESHGIDLGTVSAMRSASDSAKYVTYEENCSSHRPFSRTN